MPNLTIPQKLTSVALSEFCLSNFDVQSPSSSDTVGCDWYNDSILCWPPAPPNSLAVIPCSRIAELDSPCHPGSAYLHCGEHGVWDTATNYTECLLLDPDIYNDRGVVPIIVAYTYFSLSVISLIFLLICMYIFCSFSSLSCPRLTVHKHLMVSFIIFYFSIIVYLEPYVSFRDGLDYRQIPWLCKSILILQVYSQMSAANWLFNEGFYLHSRITVQIFNSEAPVLLFNIIGWVMPSVFVTIWAITMELSGTVAVSGSSDSDCHVSGSLSEDSCWSGWSQSPHLFYLIAAPMLVAYAINLLFLLNIVRILVSKLQADSTPNVDQVRKGMKATVVLFFFLGMNSLLFCINPKDRGIYEDAYMMTNAILKGSQGSIVCIFYCVLSNDVRMAVTKRWYQFKVRRDHARDHQRRRSGKLGGSLSMSRRSEPSVTTLTEFSSNITRTPVSSFKSKQKQSLICEKNTDLKTDIDEHWEEIINDARINSNFNEFSFTDENLSLLNFPSVGFELNAIPEEDQPIVEVE